ncbi:hypothetical protein U1Q18_052481 [Sarracenia purpurea var. burkii]
MKNQSKCIKAQENFRQICLAFSSNRMPIFRQKYQEFLSKSRRFFDRNEKISSKVKEAKESFCRQIEEQHSSNIY